MCFSTDETYIFLFMQTKAIKLPVSDLCKGNFNPGSVTCDLTYEKVYVFEGITCKAG